MWASRLRCRVTSCHGVRANLFPRYRLQRTRARTLARGRATTMPSATGLRMPEGDTIHRAARTLHRALAGKPITRFTSVFPLLNRVDEDEPIAGRELVRVE